MPHLYFLLWLEGPSDYLRPEKVNEIVSAEIPDEVTDLTGELRDLVLNNITHGPYSLDFPNAPCMARKHANEPLICQKRFPKEFQAITVVTEDGYLKYSRRQDGRTFTIRKGDREVTLNNCWVVPYNPYLLNRYRSYINVEVCGSV